MLSNLCSENPAVYRMNGRNVVQYWNEIKYATKWFSHLAWEDNIKLDVQEVGCGGMDWTEVAQDTERWRALVNAVMNIRVPLSFWHRNLAFKF
jgi:hypothetical protein